MNPRAPRGPHATDGRPCRMLMALMGGFDAVARWTDPFARQCALGPLDAFARESGMAPEAETLRAGDLVHYAARHAFPWAVACLLGSGCVPGPQEDAVRALMRRVLGLPATHLQDVAPTARLVGEVLLAVSDAPRASGVYRLLRDHEEECERAATLAREHPSPLHSMVAAAATAARLGVYRNRFTWADRDASEVAGRLLAHAAHASAHAPTTIDGALVAFADDALHHLRESTAFAMPLGEP